MFSALVPLKDIGAAAPAAPNREVWLEEKEKLGGAVFLDPKQPRTELSTFWPKLKVMPAGTGAAALLSPAESSVSSLPKENRAADAGAAGLPVKEDEEAGGGGVAVVVSSPPCFFSSEPPSAAPAPYCRSMLDRCRS